MYKGEISKSGVPILPSKRARKVPEKIKVSDDDLAELKSSSEEISTPETSTEDGQDESPDVSLDEIKEQEVTTDENIDKENENS